MQHAVTVTVMLTFGSLATAFAQRVEPAPVNDAEKAPYIKAALPLDEPRHLCIDLPGHGAAASPDRPFGVHTCKDGMWNLDERFRWHGVDQNLLLMPQYNRCLAASDGSAGAELVLADCAPSALNVWQYTKAKLRLDSQSGLCITIGPEPSELTAGGRRFPTRYVSRSLSLDTCSKDASYRQLFTITQPLDIPEPLLPPETK